MEAASSVPSAEWPVFTSPFIGYREWPGCSTEWRGPCHRTLLHSPVTGRHWTAGVNVAQCDANHEGLVPDCACGLYAYWHADGPSRWAQGIKGAIAAWGDVFLDECQFRAQFACIVALAPPRGRSARRRVMAALEDVRVPVVERDELAVVAKEEGESPAPEVLASLWDGALARRVRPRLWERQRRRRDRSEVLPGVSCGSASGMFPSQLGREL